jgi:hypothetical protein
MPTFSEITFHPFFSNVLDYIGRQDLVTKDGRKVEIKRSFSGKFKIYVDGALTVETGCNLTASAYLCNIETGVMG